MTTWKYINKTILMLVVVAGAAVTAHATPCPPEAKAQTKAAKVLGCTDYSALKTINGGVMKLEFILMNPTMNAELLAFVKTEHSEENLLFINDKRTDNKTIYNVYISATAKKQVNLPAATLTKLKAQAEAKSWEAMDFKTAREDIKKLVARDSLVRFLAKTNG